MTIVTGDSGKAGRACITELLAHNYELASVDLVRPPDVLVPFSRVELTDFGQTIEAFSQIDDRIRNVTATDLASIWMLNTGRQWKQNCCKSTYISCVGYIR